MTGSRDGASAGSPQCLLADPDPADAAELRGLLETAGLRVDVVHSGVDALARLDGPYALLLARVELSGVSGVELTRASKVIAPDRPVVLLTAHSRMELGVDAVRARADELLLTTAPAAELLARILPLIARHAPVGRTVLAAGAHPDDVELGVGAILARHRTMGDRVVICVATDGEGGGDAGDRGAEAEAAASLLGATLERGRFRDGALEEGGATLAWLEACVARWRPEVVYVHSANDLHQDHRALHRAGLVASRAVPEVFCYLSPSSTTEFRPSRFVDVTGFVERKLALLALHRSQMERRPYLLPAQVRAAATYWGRFAGWSEVEPLEIVRSR